MKFAELSEKFVLIDSITDVPPYRLTIIEKINHRSVDVLYVNIWRPGRVTMRTETVQDWEWNISGTKFMEKEILYDDFEKILKFLVDCNEIMSANV